MEEVGAMTVPAALASCQARQTVSIRAPPSSAEAGATVFVGADSVCANPEVQSSNGRHHDKQPAHVVKIKISPDGNGNSRVISTVRLTLGEQSEPYESARSKRDVLVSATNLVNEREHSAGEGGFVRISVVASPNQLGYNRQNSSSSESNSNNNNNNDNHNNNNKEKSLNGHRLEEDTMVQRGNTDNSSLTNGSSPCFYYTNFQSPMHTMVMSSGQCSPSETLDSGTCSDLDGTPPPLPKKKSAAVAAAAAASNGKSTVILNGQHDRANSLTSSGAEVDSDDNESNISCDSLNGREGLENRQVSGFRVTRINDRSCSKVDSTVENGTSKIEQTLPKTVGRRSRENLSNDTDSDSGSNKGSSLSGGSSFSKTSSTPRVRSPEFLLENGKASSPVVSECTYEERKQEQERIEQQNYENRSASSRQEGGKKYLYEDDRFYKFHVNELQQDEASKPGSNKKPNEDNDTEEYFAGCEVLEMEAIRSAKGTVRGVKNRVRAGIATFLQNPTSKSYMEKESDKLVVYFTSSGIIRRTFYDCIKVRQILRNHMAKIEERDLFHCTNYQTELRERLSCMDITLPQVFINGRYLGDFNTIERLNESGDLRTILKPFKDTNAWKSTCQFCGGYRLRLCSTCNGSKRSVLRNSFTMEFIGLRCIRCNDVGLVNCTEC
ncbi:glutaredoxin domain-containing cysteine-rich protein CG12206-like [Prorops nasuta]|uniref:glutaredoxin domain-containing cysteine-rich protein CG12206-like n=1 Tax=Prorops nasuta TaxID=863751 RepID=UPI0034CD8D52